MYVTREEVKVYHPEEGKAIKLSKNGKLISYMVVPYYALPQYDFEVEENSRIVISSDKRREGAYILKVSFQS